VYGHSGDNFGLPDIHTYLAYSPGRPSELVLLSHMLINTYDTVAVHG
jgi:hypothetical protein